jgi:inner membrane transporter RhtA
VQLEKEAVFPGDPVALDDLGCVACDLADLVQLPRRRCYAHDGRDRVAEFGRVDVRVVATDDAGALETLHAVGDRGRREVDTATELCHREPCVGLQLLEDRAINCVEHERKSNPDNSIDSAIWSGNAFRSERQSGPPSSNMKGWLRPMQALGRIRDRAGELPGYSYFVGSAVFHYLGPAFAVLLFTLVPPVGVAWLRIATAAAVYAVWRRPWAIARAATRSARLNVAAMGIVLGVMNPIFYLAIDRLPLGTVAAIEFLPVIALASLGVRDRRNALALAAGVAGVYLVTEVRISGQPLGYLFAFANAALFALYIVLAHRVSRERSLGGIDGLAAAMLVALVVITPIGGWSVAGALLDPKAIAAGIGVGISSSVVPYVRPARDAQNGALDLRPCRFPPARDRHRNRNHRSETDPVLARCPRRLPRRAGDRRPPRTCQPAVFIEPRTHGGPDETFRQRAFRSPSQANSPQSRAPSFLAEAHASGRTVGSRHSAVRWATSSTRRRTGKRGKCTSHFQRPGKSRARSISCTSEPNVGQRFLASRGVAERKGPRLRAYDSSPGWTRTNNPPVNSRMLCQLSYRGTAAPV